VERWVSGLDGGELSDQARAKILTIFHGVVERARRIYKLPSNPVKDVSRSLAQHPSPASMSSHSKRCLRWLGRRRMSMGVRRRPLDLPTDLIVSSFLSHHKRGSTAGRAHVTLTLHRDCDWLQPLAAPSADADLAALQAACRPAGDLQRGGLPGLPCASPMNPRWVQSRFPRAAKRLDGASKTFVGCVQCS
jgi:hypothetical protein